MDVIREIRAGLAISQSDFAAKIGVSFTAVNRWENGRAEPNIIAQEKIYQIATESGIPLYEIIMNRIREEAERVSVDGRVLLYHGSKSGIFGSIEPKSRDKCDFGKGFYMGTLPEQPLTLICDFKDSKFYIISADMTGLDCLDVNPDIDWAMLVALNRGRMESARGSGLYKKYSEMARGKDYIIGNIADDRMFYVLDNFFQGNITDAALVSSLKALNLGRQYVALTQRACDKIRVEKELHLSHLERICLKAMAEVKRAEGISMANEICKAHRREGRYFDEILGG